MTKKWGGLGVRLAVAAAILGTGSAWSSGTSAATPADTSSTASLGAICQSVMGIPPDNAQYQACVYSLSHYLDRIGDSDALESARKACLDMGRAPGSAALAECELSQTELKKPAAAVAEPAAGPRVRSYFYASPQEVRHREQRACAELGLDPADSVFGRCVARLSAALLEVNNPQQ